MAETRIERDLLGEREIPVAALYGIATRRAVENFPLSGRPVHRGLVRGYGAVKLACARTNAELGFLTEAMVGPLEAACQEMMHGALDEHVIVDALQGGAGTSTNMNVNEVLANRAVQIAGFAPGDHALLSPEHVNLHQSTNDTYPTALKVAALEGLKVLETAATRLTESCQQKEREFADVVKLARTQLQDAVPITLGRAFGAFADAFARDRWRVAKCAERLRVVNLGGTAVGTGLGAPRAYIFRVVDHLRQITGLGLARAENLLDATQNLDAVVEASGIVRALAASLIKVSNDLRLLASGPDAGLGEIRLPPVQVGSSIMPGKINPVIPEAVIQAGWAASGCDQTLFLACAQGNLELNHLLPLVADSLLTSLDLLARASLLLADRCIDGIVADRARCRAHVAGATATATALVRPLGYHGAQEAASTARQEAQDLRAVVVGRGLLSTEEFDSLVSPEAVMRLGSPADSAGTAHDSDSIRAGYRG
jgi:aspartate ammonia-lyase